MSDFVWSKRRAMKTYRASARGFHSGLGFDEESCFTPELEELLRKHGQRVKLGFRLESGKNSASTPTGTQAFVRAGKKDIRSNIFRKETNSLSLTIMTRCSKLWSELVC